MIYRIVLIVFLLCLGASAHAQDTGCNCTADLNYLNEKIRKTPPFKINKKKYLRAYADLQGEVAATNEIFDCFVLLNKLLLSLNDNHSRIYGKDLGATDEIVSDPEKFSALKKSAFFNAYPKPGIDLDSLNTVLSKIPKAEISGIYTGGKMLTLGVYPNGTHYNAIVLQSKIAVWEKGEILYKFIPFGNGYLLGIGGGLTSKRLISFTERVEDGFFHFMGFQKDDSQENHAMKTLSDSTYYRQELSANLTYLKIGSFNSWHPTLAKAEKFYASLQGNLLKDHLIIDLRNNGGGGQRNSDILFKILKDYAKKNWIYVLVNHRTVSNAEQFTQRLRKLGNSQIFGTRTNGSLTFEIKDSSYELPGENFVAVLTAKKHSAYLEFESQGIEPDIELTLDKDWTDQVQKYITAKD